MPYAIGRREVDLRLAGDDPVDQGAELRDPGISGEDGADVGAEHLHVTGAVLLLVGPCQLGLLDAALTVVVHRRQARDARLGVAVTLETVDVERGPGVLHQPALVEQASEVSAPRLVDAVVERVRVGVEIDLGLEDVQERVWIVLGETPGLGGVHHVVGRTWDLGGEIGPRPQPPKRFELHASTPGSASIARGFL